MGKITQLAPRALHHPALFDLLDEHSPTPLSVKLATARDQLRGMVDGGEFYLCDDDTHFLLNGLVLFLDAAGAQAAEAERVVVSLVKRPDRRPYWLRYFRR